MVVFEFLKLYLRRNCVDINTPSYGNINRIYPLVIILHKPWRNLYFQCCYRLQIENRNICSVYSPTKLPMSSSLKAGWLMNWSTIIRINRAKMTWIGFWTTTEELSVLAEKFLKYENINFNIGTTSYLPVVLLLKNSQHCFFSRKSSASRQTSKTCGPFLCSMCNVLSCLAFK